MLIFDIILFQNLDHSLQHILHIFENAALGVQNKTNHIKI